MSSAPVTVSITVEANAGAPDDPSNELPPGDDSGGAGDDEEDDDEKEDTKTDPIEEEPIEEPGDDGGTGDGSRVAPGEEELQPVPHPLAGVVDDAEQIGLEDLVEYLRTNKAEIARSTSGAAAQGLQQLQTVDLGGSPSDLLGF